MAGNSQQLVALPQTPQYREDWNSLHKEGKAVWEDAEPSPELKQALLHFASPPRRLIEIGCGSGNNAVWLAQQGYQYFGLDIAEDAIRKAKKKLHGKKLRGEFFECDILREAPDGLFDVALDAGCMHTFMQEDDRRQFAKVMADILMPSGLWICLAGNADHREEEDKVDTYGQPKLTASQIIQLVEKDFEVHYLTRCWFGTTKGVTDYLGWCGVFERR